MNKIVSIKFGSHLYGTATETSDLDIKHVYIPPARDILLQCTKNSISNKRSKNEGEKNYAGEVEEESYSLQYYLKLLLEGQTVCLDMLFSPPESLIHTSDLWNFIVSKKDKLLSKKATTFLGYCRTQANKYGIKGSRVAAVRIALKLLDGEIGDAPLFYLWPDIEAITEENEHMKIINIEQVDGKQLPHWEIVGRKFGSTTTIKQTSACLQKIMNNYGKRALLADQQNGVDWKALSHAVRVGTQAIELFKTGNITFPLVNAAHILEIKTGKILYQEVASEIERLLIEVEEASNKSNLPSEPDYIFVDNLVVTQYMDALHS
jgi:RNA repair pathway DNA polymerase beta family